MLRGDQKIGCTNDTMSEVMSKRADNEKLWGDQLKINIIAIFYIFLSSLNSIGIAVYFIFIVFFVVI